MDEIGTECAIILR